MVSPRGPKKSLAKSLLKRHYIPILLAFIVTFIGLFGSDMTLWLRFDRNAILSGEIWRLLTGHLAHLTWTHLAMNLVGLGLIWGLFDRLLPPRRWLQAMLISAIGSSVLLLIVDDHLRWYVGLSGVLHGLFMLGCMYDLRSGRWDAKFLLLVLVTKLLYEQLIGPLPGSERYAGGSVVVDAHLFGAVMGIVSYLIFRKLDVNNNGLEAHQSSR